MSKQLFSSHHTFNKEASVQRALVDYWYEQLKELPKADLFKKNYRDLIKKYPKRIRLIESKLFH